MKIRPASPLLPLPKNLFSARLGAWIVIGNRALSPLVAYVLVGSKMSTVFISHTSTDRRLALMIKDLLAQTFQGQKPETTFFCSTDVGDIEGGKKWFDQIFENLKKAKVCIALVTPQSLYFSPWVAYESGGAYLRFELDPHGSRLFPVCAYGITPGTVPSPFSELQVRNLADPKEVSILCREVANAIGYKRFKKPRRITQDIAAEASNASQNWVYVSRSL